MKHRFSIRLGGISGISDEQADSLLDAGCDDATISARGGVVSLAFSREAASLKRAIRSAYRDIHKANIPGATPAEICLECAGPIGLSAGGRWACKRCGTPLDLGPGELAKKGRKPKHIEGKLTAEDQRWVLENIKVAEDAGRRMRRSRDLRDEQDELVAEAILGLCQAALDPSPASERWRGAYRGANRHRYRMDRVKAKSECDIGDDFLAWAVEAPSGPTEPEERRPDSECMIALSEAIGALPEDESFIVRARLAGETTEAIGRSLGVGESRIRDLESHAHAAIRRALASIFDRKDQPQEIDRCDTT